jgi:uncharacterized membrane protein (DUF4010 family)
MGVLGGMTSSTVTAMAFSRQSKVRPDLTKGFALAIVLACTVMLARVAVLAASVNRELLFLLIPSLCALAAPGLIYAGVQLFRMRREPISESSPQFENPLGLKIAIQFAVLYALIVLLARAAAYHFGSAGVTAVSFLSGLTDMDAIVLSLGQSVSSGHIDVQTATGGVVIAGIANTILKAGFAMALGTPQLRRIIGAVLGATVLLGAGAWWWLV